MTDQADILLGKLAVNAALITVDQFVEAQGVVARARKEGRDVSLVDALVEQQFATRIQLANLAKQAEGALQRSGDETTAGGVPSTRLIAAMEAARHDMMARQPGETPVPTRPASDEAPLLSDSQLLAALPPLEADDAETVSSQPSQTPTPAAPSEAGPGDAPVFNPFEQIPPAAPPEAVGPGKGSTKGASGDAIGHSAISAEILATFKGKSKKSPISGYEILEKLGSGAMGTVFRAKQISMDRVVALKVLPPRLAKNQSYVDRFLREARAAAKLNHPNVVSAFDIGESGGLFYFAMEFVEGRTLKSIVEERKVLPERDALEIARQIALALEHAARQQIVHRDIKPDNIMLTEEGIAKLCDLGLAKQVGADPSLTTAGAAVGTPWYISPEQAKGLPNIDTRADLYSLGCTIFHVISGVPPYYGQTAAVVMAMHLNEPVPDPRVRNREVSHGTAAIIMKMMQKPEEARYQTPRELVEDIERQQRGELPWAVSQVFGLSYMPGMRPVSDILASPAMMPPGAAPPLQPAPPMPQAAPPQPAPSDHVLQPIQPAAPQRTPRSAHAPEPKVDRARRARRPERESIPDARRAPARERASRGGPPPREARGAVSGRGSRDAAAEPGRRPRRRPPTGRGAHDHESRPSSKAGLWIGLGFVLMLVVVLAAVLLSGPTGNATQDEPADTPRAEDDGNNVPDIPVMPGPTQEPRNTPPQEDPLLIAARLRAEEFLRQARAALSRTPKAYEEALGRFQMVIDDAEIAERVPSLYADAEHGHADTLAEVTRRATEAMDGIDATILAEGFLTAGTDTLDFQAALEAFETFPTNLRFCDVATERWQPSVDACLAQAGTYWETTRTTIRRAALLDEAGTLLPPELRQGQTPTFTIALQHLDRASAILPTAMGDAVARLRQQVLAAQTAWRAEQEELLRLAPVRYAAWLETFLAALDEHRHLEALAMVAAAQTDPQLICDETVVASLSRDRQLAVTLRDLFDYAVRAARELVALGDDRPLIELRPGGGMVLVNAYTELEDALPSCERNDLHLEMFRGGRWDRRNFSQLTDEEVMAFASWLLDDEDRLSRDVAMALTVAASAFLTFDAAATKGRTAQLWLREAGREGGIHPVVVERLLAKLDVDAREKYAEAEEEMADWRENNERDNASAQRRADRIKEDLVPALETLLTFYGETPCMVEAGEARTIRVRAWLAELNREPEVVEDPDDGSLFAVPYELDVETGEISIEYDFSDEGQLEDFLAFGRINNGSVAHDSVRECLEMSALEGQPVGMAGRGWKATVTREMTMTLEFELIQGAAMGISAFASSDTEVYNIPLRFVFSWGRGPGWEIPHGIYRGGFGTPGGEGPDAVGTSAAQIEPGRHTFIFSRDERGRMQTAIDGRRQIACEDTVYSTGRMAFWIMNGQLRVNRVRFEGFLDMAWLRAALAGQLPDESAQPQWPGRPDGQGPEADNPDDPPPDGPWGPDPDADPDPDQPGQPNRPRPNPGGRPGRPNGGR